MWPPSAAGVYTINILHCQLRGTQTRGPRAVLARCAPDRH
jgi:hypothetical protein